MSKVATISKLEELLSRIRTRAAEPRAPQGVAYAAAPAASVAVPSAVPVSAVAPVTREVAAPAFTPSARVAPPAFTPPAPPVFVPPAAPVAELAREPEIQAAEEPVEEATIPPPPPAIDADFDVDVDMASATPEPVAAGAAEGEDPYQSRERLSVAPPVMPDVAPPQSLDAVVEQTEAFVDEAALAGDVDDMLGVSAPQPLESVVEQAEALTDDPAISGDEDEELEEAPASSRRPVTSSPPEERLADLAFGAEEPQPPRHTPPPKSGRLPAPPAVEFDADVTGVRPASAASTSVDDAATMPSAQSAPSVLTAQAARPNLAFDAARVPDLIGEAQLFAPATFLELLDASLSL